MLTSDFWAKYFTVYDTLNESPAYQELMTTLKKSLQVKTGDKILDLGCGTGNLAVLLAKEGAEVVGLDFSEEALAIFKKKLPGNETVKLDIASQPLPFPDDFFDKVVSNNVLYNIPREKRPKVAQEMYRVLKPGGVCLVSNVHRGFKPSIVYRESVRMAFASMGLLQSVFLLTKLFGPTLKILYYNKKIREQYTQKSENLFGENEQTSLFRENLFTITAEESLVYAGQAYLVKAYKIIV